jgi:hypothetical protein
MPSNNKITSKMKGTIVFIALLCLININGKAQVGPDITSWIVNPDSLANIDTGGNHGYQANVLVVQYSSAQVYVTCNSIPDYPIGPWPGNPNVAAPQYFVCEFPRNPVQNTGAAIYTGGGSIGLWSNGVSIFNFEDAFHWDNTSMGFVMGIAPYATGWNRNALVFEGASFDDCLGHPQQQGNYHNHVNPKCLYNDVDSIHHSPIIGYAFDGFPVYGAYGYASAASATGPVKRMKSSYVLTTDTVRPGGPLVSANALGSMCEDYIYTAGAGDLDEHNGRFCYTPDYPDGTYAYFVTIDASLNPVYPFVIGPSYYGVPGSTRTNVTPAGADTTYTTGVASIHNNKIKYTIAPNPVEDHLYIYMDAYNMNNVKGTLYNPAGNVVRTIDNMQPSIGYSLDMSSLPAGLYVLSLEGGTTKVTEKIMKK